MKLKVLLDRKPKKDLIDISENASIRDAARIMCSEKIGVLLVYNLNEQNQKKYTGIISDSDIISAICKFDNLSNVQVSSIMTKKIIVATAEDEVQYVMNVMIRHKINHLPIIESGKISAIISMSDIIKELYAQDEIKIRYYGDYISGAYNNDVF